MATSNWVRKEETECSLSYKKDENFEEWYSEVVVCAELIASYDIHGFYILMQWAMAIWETMKEFFDREIKKMKIENCYTPLLLSPQALQRQELKAFAPEIAWVTQSGECELEVPIAIRPTSETVMYPYYTKWIRSHRDLPLKLNQWCNVVRCELSDPVPFIRSREILCQEGYTAFATKVEAEAEVLVILELYARIYEEYLAVPVVKGRKSEMEKVAGGLYTTCIEAFVPGTGRGIEGATSSSLGENFVNGKKGGEGENKLKIWQNSWSYSTRTIGVMVMVHGDDKGLVLPPKIAAVQVIVIPAPCEDADTTKSVLDACTNVVNALSGAGLRVETDLTEKCSSSWKHSHWEMKGVPLRIEIGPKDLPEDLVCAVRRDNFKQVDIPMVNLVEQVNDLLDDIQQNLYNLAKEKRDACIEKVETKGEFLEALGRKNVILAPWCDDEEVEKKIKTWTEGEIGVAAKTLCTPFDQPDLPKGTKCFYSDKPAKKWTYWGRSYG